MVQRIAAESKREVGRTAAVTGGGYSAASDPGGFAGAA